MNCTDDPAEAARLNELHWPVSFRFAKQRWAIMTNRENETGKTELLLCDYKDGEPRESTALTDRLTSHRPNK
jgi:hypothetical protein